MTIVIRHPVDAWNQWLSEPTDSSGEPASAIHAKCRYASTAIRSHPTAADTVLAVVFAACTVPQLLYWARQPDGGFYERVLFSVLLVVPLIWRRRFPLTTFAFAAAVALVQWSASISLTADVVLLVYLYTVASRYRMRVAAAAAAVLELGVLMAAVQWNLTGDLAQPLLQRVLFLSGPVAAAFLLGVSVRTRRQALTALAERAERLERDRDQQATIAATAERTRIAREMHDVVAHSLSVMVTLSEAAALKVAGQPERATAAMRQVAATGHQALDEMRRLLGVLRVSGDPDERRPQPGIAELEGLVAQVHNTGVAADLTITGTYAQIPIAVQLTVYRIVQEAITNTLKHAAGATRIGIVITVLVDAVRVDVQDNGTQQIGMSYTEGLGLMGMSERAAVHGGSVHAGPGPTSGWHVQANLPCQTMATANSGPL